MKMFFIILLITYCSKIHAQKHQSDTLILNDTSIHFIQVGNQTFEIKRTVSIEAVQPKPFWLGGGTITADSTRNILRVIPNTSNTIFLSNKN